MILGYNTGVGNQKVDRGATGIAHGLSKSDRRLTMQDHTSNAPALKVCPGCGESQPLSEYYLSRNGRYSHRCRACSLAHSRAYHRANRERRVEQIREYRESHREELSEAERARRADPAYQAKCAAELKEWRENNREHVAAYNRSQQVKARTAVNKAVARGDLPHPTALVCVQCEEAQAQHYHHYAGYGSEDWFKIIPLCTVCHGREHRVN
jgi:hypothetical protein